MNPSQGCYGTCPWKCISFIKGIDCDCPCHSQKDLNQRSVSHVGSLPQKWEAFDKRFGWLYDHTVIDPENVKVDLDYEDLKEYIEENFLPLSALHRLEVSIEAMKLDHPEDHPYKLDVPCEDCAHNAAIDSVLQEIRKVYNHPHE